MLSARWWTLAVWALAAASALFWGLKLFVRPSAAPPQTQVAAASPPARGDLTRLLGADPPPPVVAAAPEAVPDARFQLIGVVSPRNRQAAREGLALIAVDGKPPRAYRVGAIVDGQNVLQAVDARGARLGPRDGGALVALNLPPPPLASTGTLPSLSAQPPQLQRQVQQPQQQQQQPMVQSVPRAPTLMQQQPQFQNGSNVRRPLVQQAPPQSQLSPDSPTQINGGQQTQ